MKKLIILSIFILSSFSFIQAQILPELEKVKEIKLLESNRDEVRRILADYKFNSSDDSDLYDYFETQNAEITVNYSEGGCDETDSDSFDVPKWKVINVEITLSNPIKFKEAEIDLSKYRKEKWYHDIDDIYAYYDKELGIIFRINENKIEEITIIPPAKYNNLMCDKEKAKILASTKSIFDRKLKDRKGEIVCYAANVEKINLSQTNITASCDLSDLGGKKSCSQSRKVIDVATIAVDPENDVLTYSYTISGGKIVGTGSKVIWDLSGVKAGTYTITAAVDDGCGFCGYPKTKTVVVKECPNCRQN